MKKTTIIVMGAALALTTSCFEDEGNYDYKDPLNIEVGNVADSYTVTPGSDRLTISPTITPADREYDCFWTLTPPMPPGTPRSTRWHAPKTSTIR